MLYSTGIMPIFYNNYKWSITCKNIELLCYTSAANIILYVNKLYFSLKKWGKSDNFHKLKLNETWLLHVIWYLDEVLEQKKDKNKNEENLNIVFS